MVTLTQRIGDYTTHHRIPLISGGRPFIPGDDWTLLFTVKSDPDLPDDQSLIQKTNSPSMGITVSGNMATVAILRADTYRELDYPEPGDPAFEAAVGTYYWDIQAALLADPQVVKTVASGTMELIRDITRAIAPAIPVYIIEPGTPLSGIGIIVSATPPDNPVEGLGWLDSDDRVFSVWDGTVWVGQEFLAIITDPGDGGFMFLGESLSFLGEPLTSETII